MFKPTLNQMPVRDQIKLDAKRHPQSVTGWTLTGGSYTPKGQYRPGSCKLTLSGGGFRWYPEATKLPDALNDADDIGYDTTDIRRRTAEWVKTGTWSA